MFKKIKDIGDNNSAIITIIAIVILVIFLFVNSLGNRGNTSNKNECIAPTTVTDSKTSYEYNVKIIKNNETILLNIKKYKSKFLIEKTEKGMSYNYYLYYYDIYEKNSNNEYVLYNGDSFLDGIDNKLYFIDYLGELSSDGEINKTDNEVCYTVDKAEKICIASDNLITYDKDDIHIEYDVYKTENVNDFDINISNDVKDENNTIVDETIISEDNNISE